MTSLCLLHLFYGKVFGRLHRVSYLEGLQASWASSCKELQLLGSTLWQISALISKQISDFWTQISAYFN